MKNFTRIFLMTALALSASWRARADSRTLSLPNYQVRPGSILEVPLLLDNAAGLAAIRVQINFDPAVLELQTVSSGPLGDAFELSQGNGDGFVQLVFARAESLAGGTGRLAVLKFRANAGAVQDLSSGLAIADLGLSDNTGVIDLRQKDSLTTINGQVAVTLLQNIDNAHNGLPDWWEMLHALDLFTMNANLDPDDDGLTNRLEYAFGGNPAVFDARERGINVERIGVNGGTRLVLGFYRRPGDAALLYRPQESLDLKTWSELNTAEQMFGTPQDMGDGTEYIRVLGTIPVTGASAAPRGFMRVGVEGP